MLLQSLSPTPAELDQIVIITPRGSFTISITTKKYPFSAKFGTHMRASFHLIVSDPPPPGSEGQETGVIAPAPENARKKFEGHGRSRL
jgi:hypothetical protein